MVLIKPSKLQFSWVKNIPRNIFWDPTSYRHPFIFLLICDIFSLCANIIIKERTISWWVITEFYGFYNYIMKYYVKLQKMYSTNSYCCIHSYSCILRVHINLNNKAILIVKDISLFLTTEWPWRERINMLQNLKRWVTKVLLVYTWEFSTAAT